MHPLIRGAALALALHQAGAVSAELAAQGKEGLWAVAPACHLVTDHGSGCLQDH